MKWLLRFVTGMIAIAAIYMLAADRLARHQQLPSFEVQLTGRARTVRPGEVVLITATTSRDADLVQGGAFGSDIPFWPTTGARRWQALVAIPGDTPAGLRAVPVQATTSDGTIATGQLPLQIELHRQPAQPGAIVATAATSAEHPSPEAQQLDDVFTTTRPGRLWTGHWRTPLESSSAGVRVLAPNSGDVVMVETFRSTGLTVIIDHGEGLYSMFGGLSHAAVTTGSHVAAGDAIGRASSASSARWVTRLHNEDVDPLSLVYAADGSDDLATSSP